MRRFTTWAIVLVAAAIVGGVALLELRQRQGSRKAAEQFASYRPRPMGDFGSTKTLSIMPLVDWHTAHAELRGELGLSYLVETDEHRILFDVGHNAAGESPSPLEHNMETLGVVMESIDTVFISHNHLDHVGGFSRQRDRTFSIGLEQAPLPHPRARAFVPVAMSYPGASPIHADEPMRIGNGVATTGTVPRQLVVGWIDEQSLAVNVEGLGVVLIVGCGHQPIPNLLTRYDQLFDEPLYGIIGGLHLPVPEGRMKILGVDGQRAFASGDGLFSMLTMADVKAQLSLLEERELGVIGVGGHDSSDEVIEMFSRAFGEAYRYVRVGEPIVIGASGS
jgi:7,8-dihydropterin-6-yl-methyl-4-(beta-D-ribofuranosyl)aminobenzene 5'-phosphate synthase